MPSHQRIVSLKREVHDLAGQPPHVAALHQGREQGIVGVEDERAAFTHALGDDGLDVENVFEIVDAVLPDMVGLDVGHDGDVGPVVSEAGANDAAARGLKHRGLDGCVAQDKAGGPGASRVSGDDLLAGDVDAVSGGHADGASALGEHVRDHAGHGGLSVGPGDADDGDATVVVVGVEHPDDGFADVAWRSLLRVMVHADAGPGVDLYDAGARGEWLRDVGHDEMESADIETDGASGTFTDGAHGWMDNVCDIAGDSTGRDVAGIAEEDLFPCGRDGGERQSAADDKGNGGLGVELGQG